MQQDKKFDEYYLKLCQGAVYRARFLALAFGIAFMVFGFTSFDSIKQFDPTLTIINNLWPRILFNGLPFGIMYFYFSNYHTHTMRKIWLWSIGFPVLFTAACWIHVWPLMLQGHTKLYYYVHGANIIVFLMGLILVAPPPKFLMTTIISIQVLFTLPLAYIFVRSNDLFTLNFVLNDLAFTFVLGTMASLQNYRLRKRLALEDMNNKKTIEKFIGKDVTDSIFENKKQIYRPRRASGFIVTIDLRGFTRLLTTESTRDQMTAFMERYYESVANAVVTKGGYLHKSIGDGHLITFGVMNSKDDLDGLLPEDEESRLAEERQRAHQMASAVECVEEIVRRTNQLALENGLAGRIAVGAGIDFGSVEIKLVGDHAHRIELDIFGEVIARCSRLEAYTKVIHQQIAERPSVMAVSPFAFKHSSRLETKFERVDTTSTDIRDFGDIGWIMTHAFTFDSNISSRKAA